MNKHELALNHAMSAVILLQEMMLAKRLDPTAFQDEEEDLPAEGKEQKILKGGQKLAKKKSKGAAMYR